jgi:hypothetical protein
LQFFADPNEVDELELDEDELELEEEDEELVELLELDELAVVVGGADDFEPLPPQPAAAIASPRTTTIPIVRVMPTLPVLERQSELTAPAGRRSTDGGRSARRYSTV